MKCKFFNFYQYPYQLKCGIARPDPIFYVLLLILLGVVFASHFGLQHEVENISLGRRLSSLPDKRVMQLAALDGRELAADYLWLTTDRRGLNTLKGAELIDGKSRAF